MHAAAAAKFCLFSSACNVKQEVATMAKERQLLGTTIAGLTPSLLAIIAEEDDEVIRVSEDGDVPSRNTAR